MRSIKFKAWYVAGKHWFTDFSLSNDGETVYETGDRYSVADEEVILVSSLCKNDSKGKEVWEGDITKRGYVIMWSEEHALFCEHYYQQILNTWAEASYPIYTERIEIVGNIYQNPNLIK
jgi:hypothetical protein